MNKDMTNITLTIIGVLITLFFGYRLYLDRTTPKIMFNQDGQMFQEVEKGVYQQMIYENGEFKLKTN